MWAGGRSGAHPRPPLASPRSLKGGLLCPQPEDASGGSSPSGTAKSDANRASSGGGGGGLMEEMNKLLAKRWVFRLPAQGACGKLLSWRSPRVLCHPELAKQVKLLLHLPHSRTSLRHQPGVLRPLTPSSSQCDKGLSICCSQPCPEQGCIWRESQRCPRGEEGGPCTLGTRCSPKLRALWWLWGESTPSSGTHRGASRERITELQEARGSHPWGGETKPPHPGTWSSTSSAMPAGVAPACPGQPLSAWASAPR